MTVSAKRTGVYGYVGDRSNLKPLPGAIVHVLGAHMSDTTDNAARFDLPTVHDDRAYLVRVSHGGYEDKLISITVPKKSGYELGVFLSPTTERAVKLDALWGEMDTRVNWRGRNAALLTRKTLGSNPRSDLSTMLQYAAARDLMGMRLTTKARESALDDTYPCIFVNGRYLGRFVTLDQFSVGDVEAIELYGPETRQWKYELQNLVPPVQPACGAAPRYYRDENGILRPVPPSVANEQRQQIAAIVIWLKQ